MDEIGYFQVEKNSFCLNNNEICHFYNHCCLQTKFYNEIQFNFKILLAIINRGDNLKDKQANKKLWALLVKKFSCEFLPLTY